MNRVVAATAKITWTKDKVTMRLEGDLPASKSIVAASLSGRMAGEVKAETKLQGMLGEASFTAAIPVQARVGRRDVENETRRGSVVMIEVRGKI